MKIRFYWLALLVSATLIGQAHADTHRGSSGFAGTFSRSRTPSRAGSVYRPMGIRGYSGMAYPGRYSSLANRSTVFRQPSIYSGGRTFSGTRQFATGNSATTRFNQFGNNQRFAQGRNGFARPNAGLQNQRFAQGQNGRNLASNWHNHVFAQHSASWHHDWDRHHDHFWHGHRCAFINGSWFVFDFGFYPWWWDPYYYGYGYPGYGYDYGNPYDYGDQNGPNPGYSYGNPNQQYYDEDRDNQK